MHITLLLWCSTATNFNSELEHGILRMPSIRNIILVVLVLLSVSSFNNCSKTVVFDASGYSCDPRADNSTTAAFKTNLDSLLCTLQEKGPDNYGFYTAAAGKDADKLYGLVQCRGDVSAQDCSSCLKESVKWATKRCNNSNEAAVWLNWCYLRYSDSNFLGQGNGSKIALTPINTSTTDDPTVAVTGQNFMSLLSADVPNQPFLFKTGSVDVGEKGKRYGLAQCNRDLSMSGCRNCTGDLFKFYFDRIRNQSSYMLFSYGCRMWYDNYQFYFNYTLPSQPTNDPPIPTDSSTQLQISFTAAIVTLLSVIISSSAI